MKWPLLTFFVIMLATACNKSTCGEECAESEESPVVSGTRSYPPVTTTTTQAQTIPYCTTEGQGNCIVDGVNFKAVKPSNIDPWDIRVGKTVGGVSGKLKVSCRNRIRSNSYNFDGDLSLIGNSTQNSGISLDIWDTTDDLNGGMSGFTPYIVSAWSDDTDCGGVEVTEGDVNIWRDVTTANSGDPSSCSQNPAWCSMQDKITGLWWSKIQTPTTGVNWSSAWNICGDLDLNGKSDWRLPTQKELMSAYEHGIRSAASLNWISEATLNNMFWSGSTVSNMANYAWSVNPSYGSSYHFYGKNTVYRVVCVR